MTFTKDWIPLSLLFAAIGLFSCNGSHIEQPDPLPSVIVTGGPPLPEQEVESPEPPSPFERIESTDSQKPEEESPLGEIGRINWNDADGGVYRMTLGKGIHLENPRGKSADTSFIYGRIIGQEVKLLRVGDWNDVGYNRQSFPNTMHSW